MGVYKRGDTYWYRFNWYGEQVRESTKQSNKRVAEQIEAARKTALAKGEVGLHERRKAPTLADFAETDFLHTSAPLSRQSLKQRPTTKMASRISPRSRDWRALPWMQSTLN